MIFNCIYTCMNMNNKSGPRYRQHTPRDSPQPTTTIYKCKLIKFTFRFALCKTKIHSEMRNFNCNIRTWTAQRAFLRSAQPSTQMRQNELRRSHAKFGRKACNGISERQTTRKHWNRFPEKPAKTTFMQSHPLCCGGRIFLILNSHSNLSQAKYLI